MMDMGMGSDMSGMDMTGMGHGAMDHGAVALDDSMNAAPITRPPSPALMSIQWP